MMIEMSKRKGFLNNVQAYRTHLNFACFLS
jgi:hypothetical protein